MINIQKKIVLTDYDDKDESTRMQIRDEFFKKCYLCEGKPVQNYEIDHFYTQIFYPHLKNKYENLFFICSKCNKLRPKNINSSSKNEVLNNCEDDVESFISLDIDLSECKKAIIRANYTDNEYQNKKINNTIELLEKIYNGKNTISHSYKCLQDDIVTDVISFQTQLENYLKFNDEYREVFKEIILEELDKISEYSSFKKTIFHKMKINL